MKKFKVYKSNWGVGSLNRGKDAMDMCVMGQVAAQCGVDLRDIQGGGISGLGQAARKRVFQHMGLEDCDAVHGKFSNIYGANDGGPLTPEREKRLQKIAENTGFELEFVDGHAPWTPGHEGEQG